MMIEHVDAVIELRRYQTLERGAVPGKVAAALADLRSADNLGGGPAVARVDWAVDLALPVISGEIEVDVLLWLGDGAFNMRNQRTLRALVKLLRFARVDFAVLGEAELDCGDAARRLGDEAVFQQLVQRNVALLSRLHFRRILTVDPHVLNCLRNEYPAFGGVYEIIHHTALLEGLIAAGKIVPKSNPRSRITYHDPCYLGRYNGEFSAPRAVLSALGGELVEMQRAGTSSRCCGGGGGAPLADIPGRMRISDIRMNDARATGASVIAVACPNCALMLEGVTGQRPEVQDISELLLEAMG
jgi:Fe-S oxidoreductase